MNQNGYFQLENRADGVYLSVIPPQENGIQAIFEELITYLNKKKVDFPETVRMRELFEQAEKGEPVRFGEQKITPFCGWCEYTIAPDAMFVKMTMYPPVKGMSKVSFDEIENDLKGLKVSYGINKELIQKIIQSDRYFEPFVIAKGLEPVDGCDAVLTYCFNPKASAKPKILENGTVDFHQLDQINHVNEGDVVARITPENPGEMGYNIYGQEVKPKKVYRKVFKFGRNLYVSKDGTELITKVTGHVTLEDDKVFVSDEYTVKADVDTTTGDIQYDGNVRIKGAVRAGFKVKATGNINVDGVVEGAELTAGGDIILQRGISGMNRGILRADGNVIATFVENAKIVAGKDIEVDVIMHSDVTARGKIQCHGRNGSIVGGQVRAGTSIEAKLIGSEMGTTTVVAVGTDPELIKELNNLKSELAKKKQDRLKLSQIVDMLRKKKEIEGSLDAEKTAMMQKTMKSLVLLTQEISECQAKYDKESASVHEDADARIKVFNSIYPGTKLEFGEQSFFIREKNVFCQYLKKGADIVSLNL